MIRTRRRAHNRPATGEKVPVPKMVRGVRHILREHLWGEGKTIEHDLAKAWKIQPHSAHRIMGERKRSITPEHIEAAIKCLKLDEFDANELRIHAAIEAGWKINLKLQVK